MVQPPVKPDYFYRYRKNRKISKAATSNISGMLLGRAAGLQATVASPSREEVLISPFVEVVHRFMWWME